MELLSLLFLLQISFLVLCLGLFLDTNELKGKVESVFGLATPEGSEDAAELSASKALLENLPELLEEPLKNPPGDFPAAEEPKKAFSSDPRPACRRPRPKQVDFPKISSKSQLKSQIVSSSPRRGKLSLSLRFTCAHKSKPDRWWKDLKKTGLYEISEMPELLPLRPIDA